MRVGKVSIAGASLWVLAIQLAVVSSIAAKYLYQRWTCPRVWVRSAVYDPDSVLRGRYLSVQVTVDGCESTVSSAELAARPRDNNSEQGGNTSWVRGGLLMNAPARIVAQDGTLKAIRVPESESQAGTQMVMARPGASCADMQLETPVDFYIAEHAADPTPRKQGQELWVELTVPPKGPPRPVQLALKDNGAWEPLAFQ